MVSVWRKRRHGHKPKYKSPHKLDIVNTGFRKIPTIIEETIKWTSLSRNSE